MVAILECFWEWEINENMVKVQNIPTEENPICYVFQDNTLLYEFY